MPEHKSQSLVHAHNTDQDQTAHIHRTGESYTKILWYFLPELVTTLLVYSALSIFDTKLIAHLQKTTLYANAGVISTLIQFLIKIAEGLMVGTVVMCGHHNGRGDNRGVGVALVSSVWATFIIGSFISIFLYVGAPLIYTMFRVPESMMVYGVPFLHTQAVSVFFMFLYFSFVGFLRGIKNTRVPMMLYIIGGAVFMFFDWALIQGHCGFEPRALQGSALASVIQYMVMCCGALIYLLWNKDVRRFGIDFIRSFSLSTAYKIVVTSLPIMLDKATVAWSKMWIVPLVAPAGVAAIATYSAMRTIIQLVFVPALAFAQIITFLVSNDAGAGNWSGVKSNIKKVIILAGSIACVLLIVFAIFRTELISFFDERGDFVGFSSRVFPIILAFSLFDLFQIVFAAALRGAGDVRYLMMTRFIFCLAFFAPVSWICSQISYTISPFVTFVLVYAAFYLTNGLTSLLYMKRLSGKEWHIKFLNAKNAKKN